jgi:hypothetical protein
MTAELPLPPGRSGLPLLRETLAFVTDPHFVERRFARHGPIFRSHLLGRPVVFLGGAEAARCVLATHMDHFS